MIRWIFKFAAALLTGKIVASGSPSRIAGHAVRRQAHKTLARLLK